MAAKALLVTYLLTLSSGLTAGYPEECAAGPTYWCKSVQSAEDCGAIRHCTDTVWRSDDERALADPSTACKWCQRILENTHKGVRDLLGHEDLIASTLTNGCKFLPSNDVSAKCMTMVTNYAVSVTSLMQHKRYATLCRLMNVCSSELSSDNPPVLVGQHRCTWGPSYWCSSLSNSRECSSVAHCSDQIWSRQVIAKKPNDNICQYCEFVIGKLRAIITNNTAEIDVGKWLSGACSMLQNKEIIDKCVQTMSAYGEEILVLIKHDINPGVVCHLGQMCNDVTIVARVQSEGAPSKENEALSVDIAEAAVDEQSRMLCNTIVRATYELYANQQKSADEVHAFLKDDCRQLSTAELIHKCESLVEQRAEEIYQHVASNKDLSEVCDHLIDSTASQSASPIQCDRCTFVLATTKSMLDAQQAEEKVLAYLDEHVCVTLTGETQKTCKNTLENNSEKLLDGIRGGTHPILLCTYFQTCLDRLTESTSPVQKVEMISFLHDNICENLGPFAESCHAVMEANTTRLMKTLVNEVDADALCQLFGVCPMKMSFMDNLSVKDDTNKCKRCVDDFTRRKHIAEKLLNHSSEYLHHLCGQLPQEDECVKSVDESITQLVEFIRSLNLQEICVELKACDQELAEKIQPVQITPSDNSLSQEVMTYIKNDICARIGSLSHLCDKLIDSEGANLLAMISRDVDPHKVCSVLDICPTTTAFENCTDKCECCVSKTEKYQVRLATFLYTIRTTMKMLCQSIPNSNECRAVVGSWESKIEAILANFVSMIDKMTSQTNATHICQALTHCSAVVSQAVNGTHGEKCASCQEEVNVRQKNFRAITNAITATRLSFCTDDACRSLVRSSQQETLNNIDKISAVAHCQHLGMCSSPSGQRPTPFLTDLLVNAGSDLELSDSICSHFGDWKSTCEHLFISAQSARYMNVYMAVLENNSDYIDADLRGQNTTTCDTCKIVVQSVKDFWSSALESVRNALLQTCERCPSKDQCQQLWNERFDNLKSCVDKINPQQFCQKIRLCSAIAWSDSCSTCVERLELRKDAALQAVDRLAGYFSDLCQRFAEKQCQAYVKEVHDAALKSVEEFNPKETCAAIGFCTSGGNDSEINFNQYEIDVQSEIEKNVCSSLGPFEILCKAVAQGNTKQIQTLKLNYEVEDLMRIGEEVPHPLSEKEDRDECSEDKCCHCIHRVMQRKRHMRFIGDAMFFALIRSCDRCPVKHQCRRHYIIAKARFDCRIERIQPKRVCIRFGFCNKTVEFDGVAITPEQMCEETSESAERPEIQPADLSNSTCILCEYAMNMLSSYINRQSTEKEIEQSLEKLCNQMPSVLQHQCHEYIDNYGSAIIATLLREFELSTICRKLNLCTSKMKIDITDMIKADTASCGVCNYISTYLHSTLQRDSSDEALSHALSTMCSYLSNEHGTKCQTIIQFFSPHIRRLELSPAKSFCKQLTICQVPMIELAPAVLLNKKENKNQPSVDTNRRLTPKCTLCQYVIAYLDASMKNNKSEQAFEEALQKVCSILPGKERSQCDDFVKTYGSTLAQLIVDMADPIAICRYLNMCEGAAAEKSTSMPGNEDEQTAYTCTICQFIVSQMKHFTGLNQPRNDVLQSLNESCDLFSVDDLRQQCKAFLNRHASYFLPMISTDIKPRLACQSIQICSQTLTTQMATTSTASTLAPLKYGKCIFGMNYWCTSRENAQLCHAEDLCQRYVWSKKADVIH